LATTGWKEPGPKDPFTRTFYEQCFHFGFHHTLGISERQFQDWLEGQAVEVEAPPVLKVPNDMVTVSASLLAALAAKAFVIIAGTTGTGKTQTIRSCVPALCPADTEPGFNHVFVPVEAGWTDGRHLLGYRNPFGRMGESYSTTPLLSLLLRANYPAHAPCPFFVILDEMNLSYVEMYFSRFLSLMETSAGGQPEAVLGPSELRLLLRSAPSAVDATYIEHAITSGGLFLSHNVFIVGTVNVDETTHMFSPKVLDRAFVLEFPTILPSQKPDEFSIAGTDAAEGSVSDFWHYLVESYTITPSKDEDTFLDEVYGKLERFQFGPRVTTEAQRYLTAVKTLTTTAICADEFLLSATVRDRVLMQKILPKLHGNRSQVGKVVNDLVVLARDGNYERARAKLTSMANDLRSPGFTSYFA
jgi:5-methylcytosine-specific restriction endonuclease McrBC GTP-binding regulatory subunit McrB